MQKLNVCCISSDCIEDLLKNLKSDNCTEIETWVNNYDGFVFFRGNLKHGWELNNDGNYLTGEYELDPEQLFLENEDINKEYIISELQLKKWDGVIHYWWKDETKKVDLPKESLKEETSFNLTDAAHTLRRKLKDAASCYDEDPIKEYEDRVEFALRSWGDWEVSDDDRYGPDNEDEDFEDWDWKVMTSDSKKLLKSIKEEVEKTYNVKIYYQFGEKEWIYFEIKNINKE